MRFIFDDAGDIIQKTLMSGRFFEEEELKVMLDYIPKNGTVFDIGANIGNHTVYFSKHSDAQLIVAFEPIPRAYKMLLCNIALNYCHNVNVDFIGLALGSVECVGYPYMKYEHNLGSVSLSPNEILSDTGMDPVKVVRGDDIVGHIPVDFIKMDIEGMEMVALSGLKKTIDRNRPNIFVEVDATNMEDFLAWQETNQYRKVWENTWENINYNFMLVPKEKLTG